ncbi:MAG: 3-dehydroquinate synthase [Parvularculaceae bacterium]
MVSDPRRIPVALGDRSYDALVGAGLLERAGEFLKPLAPRPWTVVVSDANVAAAQGARLRAGLSAAGFDFEEVAIAAGERSKSFAQLERLIERLLSLEVERTDVIVAFGGGVVGDLVGLAAGLLRRGCRFAQVPTSLLAQVDSAVGGKTAINAAAGKNLVGLFHQPALVLADVAALATLPAREMRAGYAEIVKVGAIDRPDFFAWLEREGPKALAGDGAALTEAIAASIAAKAAIVAADERERGARALLNLGHTFGHALEAVYDYDGRLTHGEAVALGMGLAFDYAVERGECPAADADRLKAHLTAVGLPSRLADAPPDDGLTADRLVALMMQDKKVAQGRLTLILPTAIGAARIVADADPQAVRDFLAARIDA